MQALARRFWNICLFRSGPQDVPLSGSLLLALVALNLVLDFAIVMRPGLTPERVFVFVVISDAAALGVVYVGLVVLGYARRALQTLTALAGTGLVFDALQLPAQILATTLPPLAAVLTLLFLALQVWNLAVIGYIFHHAFSIHWLPAALLTLGYLLLAVKLSGLLLPAMGH